MPSYLHVPGTWYRIVEGVRRAKAAQLSGHITIRAEVVDPSGPSLGECELPLSALRSPKDAIRRVTPADVTRWHRVEEGAKDSNLPFPPITVQPFQGGGTEIEDVSFDFGGSP